MNKRNCVLDANIVITLAFLQFGKGSAKAIQVRQMWERMSRPVFIDGTWVTLAPVVSHHILNMMRTVCRRGGLTNDETVRAIAWLIREVKSHGGTIDATAENYRELATTCERRVANGSTDTEDEAIIACVDRHQAVLITDDGALGSYADALRIPAFSAKSCAAKTFNAGSRALQAAA